MKTLWNIYTKTIIGVVLFALFAAGGVNYYTKKEADVRFVKVGDLVTPTSFDTLNITDKATAPTMPAGTNTTDVATTGFVFYSIYTPYTGGVVEQKTRTANQNTTYSGTIRNVPGTYATLTAAYTAASNGDVIQLANGTYDMASESGGYWLVNTTSKGVLVKGNASDPTAVKLTCSSASYGIRLRDCAAMTFQDLTIESTGAAVAVFQDQAYASRWVKFKNCIFTKSGTAKWLFERTSLTSDTNPIWIEFDGCTINQATAQQSIVYTASGVNEKILFTNCTFNHTNASTTYNTINYTSGHKGLIAIYECTFNCLASAKILQIGEDETVPTNTTFQSDIRNCSFNYTSTNTGHGLLLGRGTVKTYVVNNTITLPNIDNSLAIGLVIKTTASSVGDSYFAGNIITAPRPLLIKGGQNNIIKFNSCKTVAASTYSALDVENPEATRLSIGNVVRFNNFYGSLAGLKGYAASGYESAYTTIKGWTINNNRYYSTNGTFAVSDQTPITFVNKRTLYDNNNDNYSLMTTSNVLNINPIQNIDATSTISW